jgi:hypothetical protein
MQHAHTPAKILRLVVLLTWFGLTTFDIVSVAAGEKGDLYRHVERDGTLSFTNVPSDGRYTKSDPEDNIAGGARYLRYLLDRFNGNLPLALAAYNAGATRVEQYATLPPIRETRRYVKKVLRYYRMFGDRRFPEPQTFKPFVSVTWPRTAPVAIVPNP